MATILLNLCNLCSPQPMKKCCSPRRAEGASSVKRLITWSASTWLAFVTCYRRLFFVPLVFAWYMVCCTNSTYGILQGLVGAGNCLPGRVTIAVVVIIWWCVILLRPGDVIVPTWSIIQVYLWSSYCTLQWHFQRNRRRRRRKNIMTKWWKSRDWNATTRIWSLDSRFFHVS